MINAQYVARERPQIPLWGAFWGAVNVSAAALKVEQFEADRLIPILCGHETRGISPDGASLFS